MLLILGYVKQMCLEGDINFNGDLSRERQKKRNVNFAIRKKYKDILI